MRRWGRTAGAVRDRLDNFGRRSTDRIHPEWQQIRLGDRLAASPTAASGGRRGSGARTLPGLRMSLDLAAAASTLA